jgi:hypothetical protein
VDYNHEVHFDTASHLLAETSVDGNLYVAAECTTPNYPATECVSGITVTPTLSTASSSLNSTLFPTTAAFDSDLTTYWVSGDTGNVTLDLSVENKEITKVVIQWMTENAVIPSIAPAAAYELWMYNGTKWKVIGRYLDMKCPSGSRMDTITLHQFNVTVVRIVMQSRCGLKGVWDNQAKYFGISEIRVYEQQSVLNAAFFVGGAENNNVSTPFNAGSEYSGRVGINTADPTHTLTVNGSAIISPRDPDSSGFEGGAGTLGIGGVITVEASTVVDAVQSDSTSLVLASDDLGYGDCFECILGINQQVNTRINELFPYLYVFCSIV